MKHKTLMMMKKKSKKSVEPTICEMQFTSFFFSILSNVQCSLVYCAWIVLLLFRYCVCSFIQEINLECPHRPHTICFALFCLLTYLPRVDFLSSCSFSAFFFFLYRDVLFVYFFYSPSPAHKHIHFSVGFKALLTDWGVYMYNVHIVKCELCTISI